MDVLSIIISLVALGISIWAIRLVRAKPDIPPVPPESKSEQELTGRMRASFKAYEADPPVPPDRGGA